jgi:dienelactone hydrolase
MRGHSITAIPTRLLGIAVFVVVLGGQALAERRETFQVSSTSRNTTAKVDVTLLLPETRDARVPAMVIVHGSGGVRANREFAYAQEFLKLGVAAAVIDSFRGRGVTSTVRDQKQVRAQDMLVDAANTLKVLARHPAIDPERIGLIGFSKGGTTVTKAGLRRYIVPLTGNEARFALAIALYPWCGDFPLDLRPAGAPVYLLLGADDSYTGTASCLEYARRVQAAGGTVVAKTYAAKHGWDVPGSADWSDALGENHSKCIYDETAAGTWIERGSKIKVMDNNKPAASAAKAAARCMTKGVSGGYGREAHTQSLQDIRGFVRETFRLR